MGIGIKELVIILIIVGLMFGTKKIKGLGSDVGGWIRDFKKALREGKDDANPEASDNNRVIDAEPVASPDKTKS
jgi:sec-independent protein translocase protein TatA